MASVGISISRKMETRRAWLYCMAILLASLLLVATKLIIYAFFYEQYYGTYSNYCKLSELYSLSLSFFRCLLPAIPTIAFVFLLHSLHKRLVLLNAFLRCLFFLRVFSIDENYLKNSFMMPGKHCMCVFFFVSLEIGFFSEMRQNKSVIFGRVVRFMPLNLLDNDIANWSK